MRVLGRVHVSEPGVLNKPHHIEIIKLNVPDTLIDEFMAHTSINRDGAIRQVFLSRVVDRWHQKAIVVLRDYRII